MARPYLFELGDQPSSLLESDRAVTACNGSARGAA
jgi:hypothetical protein